MRLDLVTIFPDYFAPLGLSLVGKAVESGVVELAVHDLRRWTHDVHRSVDDTPFGGGAGMVMRAEPWGEALDELLTGRDQATTLVVPTPAGVPFSQVWAQRWAARDRLIFACGRYEGIDARFSQYAASRVETVEVSLGDYVLNGGEVAALAMVEAVVRLLPGVLGNPESLVEESHSEGWGRLLEYPVYTKPASWRGLDVPAVLLSGHHAQIARWRRDQALESTRRLRPDLLDGSESEPV
ncbi:MAG: tRNA (guanosine(37)-N1)-methyltransferase TrmD [Propionibacteriaceae bacterium]|nr:tRNA (guanosine(37)-N1)-methyltransferase TrmD [Propionibacteriaceae bacterium]